MDAQKLKQVEEALMAAKATHGMFLMSDPPKDAWKYYGTSGKIDAALSLIREEQAAPPVAQPVDAGDIAFLAARLRRLFAHFDYPLPAFAADDARLVGIAGSAIGGLLTRWETAQPIAWVNGDDLHNKANATIACGAERRYVNGHAYDTPLYLDATLSLIREAEGAPYKRPQECAASGQGHFDRPSGPRGEVQCEYCGQPPTEAEEPVDSAEPHRTLSQAVRFAKNGIAPTTEEVLSWELALAALPAGQQGGEHGSR
jgi:hypothetical protein